MSDLPEQYDEKQRFLDEMEDIRPDLMYPESWDSAKVDLANKVVNKTSVVKQMFSAIPMRCKGDKCHPAGTRISTSDGVIKIEDLDPEKHFLRYLDVTNNAVRGGYPNGNIKGKKFTIHSKQYTGWMINLETDNGYSQKATHDHISIFKWNKNTQGHCVYLMRRENNWRIGKSQLFSGAKGIGPIKRAGQEDADVLWILGVYETNTEALLAEEYFSVTWMTPKALFKATIRESTKWSGLYKWVTQEQLDAHHNSIMHSEDFYRDKLLGQGLCIDHPFWSRNDEVLLEASQNMRNRKSTGKSEKYKVIYSCNLLSKYMSVPTEEDEYKNKKYSSLWSTISVGREYVVDETVYSLDVEGFHTYFANAIGTHNCPARLSCPLYLEGIPPVGQKCPIEMRLIRKLSEVLGESLQVDFNDFTEVSQLRVIVDQEIQMMRASNYLAEEGFIMDNVIGIGEDGEAILKKEMSLAVELQDRIHKRLKDYRSQLLATRADRVKINQGEVDSAKAVAKILKEVSVLNLERERALKLEIGNTLSEEVIDIDSME